MSAKTLFEKLWELHEVQLTPDGSSVLYIDRHYLHEVTSPQAFTGLRERNLPFYRPGRSVATADHNVPTIDQHLPIQELLSANQVKRLIENCEQHNISLYGLGHPWNGIVHVIGPELGLTRPGMTIVCGDSHTSTHGAFGTIAFGIGTSEVEMVMASQCVIQQKPKSMRISVEGKLNPGVTAKDVILHIIAKLGTGGGTGYFVEFAGETIRSMSMESRMTLCNMSIEMGSRGGLVAPDETTFAYLKNREYAPKGQWWDESLAWWKTLKSDPDAQFDKEYHFLSQDIGPMITFGTNPGAGMVIDATVPDSGNGGTTYMDLKAGEKLIGHPVDYVFLGSCTNGRIEDFRDFARIVKGRKKAPGIVAWLVPGSKQVEEQVKAEGINQILQEAGFELRQPGCSACLAMNEDKVPPGKYCMSTSNRNFEGRQGPGARTMLASPLTAAAAAVTGVVSDPRVLIVDTREMVGDKSV